MYLWICVFLLAVVVYSLNPINRWRYRHIPGPRPYPLIGSLPLIMEHHNLGEVVNRLRSKYGPMVKLFFGRTPIAYISDADMAKQVLSANFTSFPGRGLDVILPRPLPADSKELDTLGVFESKGDHWKTLRPHWHSYLSNSEALRHYSALMAKSMEKICLFLRSHKGQAVDVVPSIRSLTMEVVGETAFGVSFQDSKNFEDGNKPPVVTAAEYIVTSLSAEDLTTILSICAPILLPVLRIFSPIISRDVIKARRDLKSLSRDLVRKARGELRRESADGSSSAAARRTEHAAGSFLSNLSHVVDKHTGEKLPEEEISAQAAIMVLAGYETTASTLSTGLWLLAAHPGIQQKLLDEIDEQRRAGNGGSEADLSSATYPYLDAFLNEVLRLYNPAGWIARDCVKPCEVGGVKFTPGMFPAVCIWALHRNPKYWGLDAEDFRPERWLEPGFRENLHPFAFLPFGAGPRVCPGKSFAVQEAKMALVRVLSEFRIEAKEGETVLPVQVKEAFTIGPAHPVKVVPVLRSG